MGNNLRTSFMDGPLKVQRPKRHVCRCRSSAALYIQTQTLILTVYPIPCTSVRRWWCVVSVFRNRCLTHVCSSAALAVTRRCLNHDATFNKLIKGRPIRVRLWLNDQSTCYMLGVGLRPGSKTYITWLTYDVSPGAGGTSSLKSRDCVLASELNLIHAREYSAFTTCCGTMLDVPPTHARELFKELAPRGRGKATS